MRQPFSLRYTISLLLQCVRIYRMNFSRARSLFRIQYLPSNCIYLGVFYDRTQLNWAIAAILILMPVPAIHMLSHIYIVHEYVPSCSTWAESMRHTNRPGAPLYGYMRYIEFSTVAFRFASILHGTAELDYEIGYYS